MKLNFLYHPVENLEKSVVFYRDVLGWDEAWRMGETTAAMTIPDSEITVMLDIGDPYEHGSSSGFFQVDDIDVFYEEKRDRMDFVVEPMDLPPIRYAAFIDPDGNLFRIFTETED